MRVLVLGSAAGGGSPQWNCNCAVCRRVRAGAVAPRTQCSVAVSADGVRWVVLNASPDLWTQIERTPALHPQQQGRSSPIASVVLTGGEVDTVAGLLTLRERQALTVYASAQVLAILQDNPIFGVLAADVVQRVPLALEQAVTVAALTIRAFPVAGKVPLFLEGGAAPALSEDQTIGLEISDGRATLFFIPGCAAMMPALADRLRGADAVLFDGTLWTDDEMIRAGIGSKTGRRMGHMSVSGPDGTLAAFATLGVRQRVLLHINNSNPILLDDSKERAEVEAAGWVVAFDGMELRV